MNSGDKITRQQLEGKFKALQDELQNKFANRKDSIATAIAVGGAIVVLLAYILGSRRGRKRRGVIEIRRG